LRWIDTSLIAVCRPSGPSSTTAGSSSTSKPPENARSNSVSISPGSIVARKPTSPKFTANTGTSVYAKRRSALRIVPSPPSTTHRSTGWSGSQSAMRFSCERRPCLAVSSASKHSS
jgi:hypothetical protein